VKLYVIDRVISEKDLRKIPNRPLPEQIEIYTILANSCGGAAKTHNKQWRRNDQERPFSACAVQALVISREGEMWQKKAQEAQERFSERCFGVFGGPHESTGLSTLVEFRFQRG
jgi:hypothetical protein